MPTEGLYVHMTMSMNLDSILGDNFSLTEAKFAMKTGTGYVLASLTGSIKLWDDKDYGLNLEV